jgi:ADP-L-glycero-D-manno-heptose 6-epimerase
MSCAFLLPAYRHIGGIFNIGLGKPTTWNEMARALLAALDCQKTIEYVEMPPDLARQYQNYTCADVRKFHKIFGSGTVGTPIPEAVGEYVQEYLLRNARW